MEQASHKHTDPKAVVLGIVGSLLAIAVLGSLLFPVFASSRSSQQHTPCTSQVRQIATAIQMYVQDNHSRYPGVTATSSWNMAIDNYVGSQKVYLCTNDAADDTAVPISYGYSGLLVRADGSGVNEAQVKAPTEVGAIADATTRAWTDGGGLIGGGALGLAAPVSLVSTRHTGVFVGFCDGHAKYFPGKAPHLKQIDDPLSRAFYQAVGLGLVQNYAGGLNNIPLSTTKHTVSIGGDYAGMPLVMAAVEVWAAQGGTWDSHGFTGSGGGADLARATKRGHYLWADSGDDGPGTIIAHDALAVIVSQNCKIDGIAGFDLNTAMSPADIAKPFQTGAAGTPGYSMATGAHWQAYTYAGAAKKSPDGNTRYFTRAVLAGGRIGRAAQRVRDDAEMVDKVCADPYGIGYCSTAMADTSKVKILDILVTGTARCYPSSRAKTRWVVPNTAAASRYPFVRALRVRTGGDGARLLPIFTHRNYLDGPLFKASYFQP